MPHSSAGIEARRPVAAPSSAHSLREAQAFCARLAREHYENFPVASVLVPASIRPAVQAIYAFARIADDFADEEVHEGRRLERLDEWGHMLEDCFQGRALHPVFVALREAARGHDLPAQPFRDLLAAFRMDVERRRYPDYGELLRYCRLSADPVGRLVLHLFGHREPRLIGLSNGICTALQLANHWQDIAIDLARDRIYLPEDDRTDHGVTEEDLRAGKVTEGFRALMRLQIERARALLAAGRPLCDAVRGRLRWELRLTWLGGERVLERIEMADYDVFRRRPRLGTRDALVVLGRAARWAS
ncbi:MAG TPA: squalene synthase HpnC [Candidatus Polarisedimenticolia bacterium]|nr:squalene synthase HpnC [Candidatus Polarisedimenticolia bacterium]